MATPKPAKQPGPKDWGASVTPSWKGTAARAQAAGVGKGLAKKLYSAGFTVNKKGALVDYQVGRGASYSRTTGRATGATKTSTLLAQRAYKAGVDTSQIADFSAETGGRMTKAGQWKYTQAQRDAHAIHSDAYLAIYGQGGGSTKHVPPAKEPHEGARKPSRKNPPSSPQAPAAADETPHYTPIYAEGTTTITDLGGMRGKPYKGTGASGQGTTGGGERIPGTAPGNQKPEGKGPSGPKAKKRLKTRGHKKKSGTAVGFHINKKGEVVPNKGKKK